MLESVYESQYCCKYDTKENILRNTTHRDPQTFSTNKNPSFGSILSELDTYIIYLLLSFVPVLSYSGYLGKKEDAIKLIPRPSLSDVISEAFI